MEIRLSAFADEASADLLRQIETLHRERIPLIELRGVNGKNVAELEDEEALRCREQLDAGGIAVWSIGSPLGKIGVREDFSQHLKKAERVFRLANIFATTRVRVFSFYTDAPERDEAEVFARMRAMSELAKEYGVTLYHENEKEIYGDIPVRNAKLLDNIPELHCVFDPANYVQCGADIAKALELLEGNDIEVTVDLSQLKADAFGTCQVPAEVTIPGFSELGAVGTYEVSVFVS